MSRAWRRGAIVSGPMAPRCRADATARRSPHCAGSRRSDRAGPAADDRAALAPVSVSKRSRRARCATAVATGRMALRRDAWCAPCMSVCAMSASAGAVLPAAASVGRTHLRRGQQNENTPHRNLPCCKHESPTCPGVRFAVMRGDVSARHSVRSEHSGSFWTLTCMRDARGRQVPVGHRGYPRGRAQTGTHVFRTVLPSRAARACRAPRARAALRAGADARREGGPGRRRGDRRDTGTGQRGLPQGSSAGMCGRTRQRSRVVS